MGIYLSELDFKSIDELASATYNVLVDIEVDAEAREWGAEKVAAKEAEIQQARRGAAGFVQFATTYVKREADRAQLYRDGAEAADTPYDSLRETPLCTCNDRGCELKTGVVPRMVRDADDPLQGLTEYTLEHAGNPIVLDHEAPPGARQAWNQQRAEVRTLLFDVFARVDPELDGDVPESAYADREANASHDGDGETPAPADD